MYDSGYYAPVFLFVTGIITNCCCLHLILATAIKTLDISTTAKEARYSTVTLTNTL